MAQLVEEMAELNYLGPLLTGMDIWQDGRYAIDSNGWLAIFLYIIRLQRSFHEWQIGASGGRRVFKQIPDAIELLTDAIDCGNRKKFGSMIAKVKQYFALVTTTVESVGLTVTFGGGEQDYWGAYIASLDEARKAKSSMELLADRLTNLLRSYDIAFFDDTTTLITGHRADSGSAWYSSPLSRRQLFICWMCFFSLYYCMLKLAGW